ncbi:hypothetical protein TFLX_01260 [Thermoflexales bacterium]|nr:hypothetical protein TFLX_01260 [Thermoflexales bacterium]
MKSLGQRLTEIRKEASLSQKELASRVGCDNSSISRIEGGTRLPTPAMLSRILKVCGAVLEWRDSEYRSNFDEIQHFLDSPAVSTAAHIKGSQDESALSVREFQTLAAAANSIAKITQQATERLVVDIIAGTGGTTVSSVLPVILQSTPASSIEVSLYLASKASPFSSYFPKHWSMEAEVVLERIRNGGLASKNAQLKLDVFTYDFLPVFHGIMLNKGHLWLGFFGWRHFSGKVELSGAENPHHYYFRQEHYLADYFFRVFEDWLENMPCEKMYSFSE